MEIRPMRADERESVLELLESAFGERELFALYMDHDPDCEPEDFLLALDGARPVSCVQIFSKTIRLRGQAVPLGGIGSVASHPDYRKRGLAYELLRRSEARMRERGMVIGLLFAALFDFYSRLGWVQLPAHALALHGPRETPALPAGLRLRPFAAADLPQVRAHYDRHSGGIEGTTLRDSLYWAGQLRYAGGPDEDFRVAERDGRIVAYARTAVVQVPQALELGRGPDDAEAAAALLIALCPHTGALFARLPEDAQLEEALVRRGCRIDRVRDPSLMWRVLDPDALSALTSHGARDERALLADLIERPRAHYWASDRF